MSKVDVELTCRDAFTCQLPKREGNVQYGLFEERGVQEASEGLRLAGVPDFKAAPAHSSAHGSPQGLFLRLMRARLLAPAQPKPFFLSFCMKENRKDHSTRRGLMNLLAQRNNLLKYLFRTDRPKYDHVIKALNIRSRLVEEV